MIKRKNIVALLLIVVLCIVAIVIVISLQTNEDESWKRPIESYSRYAFLEIPKADFSCIGCQRISEIVEDLYKSGQYPFYYVVLPAGNLRAGTRTLELNLWGYPTIYIDGGYDLIVGSNIGKLDIARKIVSAADSRRVNITITTQAILSRNNSNIILTSFIQNHENYIYNGSLLVYLTEINSSAEQGSSQTHFALVDFPVFEHLSIPLKGNVTIEKQINQTILDANNSMFFSVVFNGESHTKYSQPPDKNPFEAHYVDVINATRIR